MAKVYGFDDSQYARLAAMLREYETGAFGSSEKPLNPPRLHPENHIRYWNDSGEAIPPYAVMRITGVNNAGVEPWRVKVGKPNTTFYTVYLVNSPARCPVSDIGWGTYLFDSGIVLCDSTYVPTVGQEWGPTSGAWSLVRHRPGFLIDGGPAGSGSTYRAVAKQRIISDLFGKADSAITKGTTGTVSVWTRAASTGTYVDSTYNVTAFAIGDDVADAVFCSLRFDCGQWACACLEQ